MKRALFFTVILAAFVAGCAHLPKREVFDSLTYGLPLSAEVYDSKIKESMELKLLDPQSALYKFSEPRRIWYRSDEVLEGKVNGGWGVATLINAKNTLGGYVGWNEFLFIFSGGDLVDEIHGMPLKAGKNSIYGWADEYNEIEK
ncbi:MAG TPA: hypothetical protein PKZ83_16775 [bacterium]|nr:hypothetical protein [bacterium]HQJ66286.1 hypothetical protein [bacterium]